MLEAQFQRHISIGIGHYGSRRRCCQIFHSCRKSYVLLSTNTPLRPGVIQSFLLRESYRIFLRDSPRLVKYYNSPRCIYNLNTHTCIYIYISYLYKMYMCVCVRNNMHTFSETDVCFFSDAIFSNFVLIGRFSVNFRGIFTNPWGFSSSPINNFCDEVKTELLNVRIPITADRNKDLKKYLFRWLAAKWWRNFSQFSWFTIFHTIMMKLHDWI